jgi:hypothetical protein
MTTPPGYVLIKSDDLQGDKNRKVALKDTQEGGQNLESKISIPSKNSSFLSHTSVNLKPGSKVSGFSIGRVPKVYTMLFRTMSNQSNSVAGVDLANFSFNISGAADFSSAAALFSECRCIGAKITLSPSLPSAGVVSRQIVGLQPGSTSAPSAEADVLQLQPLKLITTGMTKQVELVCPLPDMLWAQCSSPVPGPYAGLYGGFWFSSTGQANMSTVTALLEVLVEFRGRT